MNPPQKQFSLNRAHVAAEVKNPGRNITRALISGTCAVTVLYPLPLIVFAGFCLFLAWSAITYKPWMAAGSGIILLAGLGVYRLDQRKPGTSDTRTLSETDTPFKQTP